MNPFFNQLRGRTAVGFLCLVLLSGACKKEKPVVLTGAENLYSSEPSINGAVWNNVSASFLPNKRIMALQTVSDKLIVTLIYNDLFSAVYDGNDFEFMNAYVSSYGSGFGIERMKQINGTTYGFGQLGQYGSFHLQQNSFGFNWTGGLVVGTNIIELEELNGTWMGAFGASPYVRKSTGAAWSQAGDALNGSVNCIEVFNGEIYIGGAFTLCGSTTVNHIARWDGTNWLPLGQGLNGDVYDLIVYNGKLTVAGKFSATVAGNTNCRYIAQWDGSNWLSLSTGMQGGQNGARKLLTSGNQLFVGGDFSSAGGVSSQNIIKWTDIGGWENLAGGVWQPVGELAIYNGKLYVANAFPVSNGNFLKRLD